MPKTLTIRCPKCRGVGHSGPIGPDARWQATFTIHCQCGCRYVSVFNPDWTHTEFPDNSTHNGRIVRNQPAVKQPKTQTVRPAPMPVTSMGVARRTLEKAGAF